MFVAPISRLTIVAGKVVGESLVALCQGVGVVVFALLFGVHLSPGQVAALLPAGIVCCLVGGAWGLATLAALPNQRAALQVFPFLILPQYFLAGVIAPLRGAPRYLVHSSGARLSQTFSAPDLTSQDLFQLTLPPGTTVGPAGLLIDQGGPVGPVPLVPRSGLFGQQALAGQAAGVVSGLEMRMD